MRKSVIAIDTGNNVYMDSLFNNCWYNRVVSWSGSVMSIWIRCLITAGIIELFRGRVLYRGLP